LPADILPGNDQTNDNHVLGIDFVPQVGTKDLDQCVGQQKGHVEPSQLGVAEVQICGHVRLDHSQRLPQEVGHTIDQPKRSEGEILLSLNCTLVGFHFAFENVFRF
jgi:hypothetical protein